MAAGPQHSVGDQYVAEVADPPLTLVVSYNAYQRWTVVIIDRSAAGAVLDLHEESTLAQAQLYAEGYASGASGGMLGPQHWIVQRP
jgi:hypothetical protein